jgi:hypothetical protein
VAALNTAMSTGGSDGVRDAQRSGAHAVAAAGVLLRQYDAMADDERPWLICAPHTWCGPMADRWPSSIVNARHPGTYSPDEGGLILDARLVRLHCGCAHALLALSTCPYAHAPTHTPLRTCPYAHAPTHARPYPAPRPFFGGPRARRMHAHARHEPATYSVHTRWLCAS